MLASIEAMSCGTPIVVSREADAPYIEEQGAGIIIDYDLESAVDALSTIAGRLEFFQENALRLVEEKFSPYCAEHVLTSLFEERLGPHVPQPESVINRD